MLRRGAGITNEEIREVTSSLERLSSRPDDAAPNYAARLSSTCSKARPLPLPTQGDGLAVLTTGMWRLQAGAFLRQAELTHTALEEQYAVDAGLLDADGSDPRRLGWLAGTHVHAGVLAVWEGAPVAGQLRIAGSYDPRGVLADILGTLTTPEQFPPAQLIAAANIADREACIVVPVATRERAWGLLAVIGEINTSSTLETYQQWATQLCGWLAEQGLQEAVRASEERYALAARASNDGLWEWDLEAGGVYMSERGRVLLGFGPSRDVDPLAHWMAQVHPDDAPRIRRAFDAVTTRVRETVKSENRVRVADGSYRWLLVRAIGVPSADGRIVRLVGSLSDIHERTMP